jgi:molybdopterin molybdotransferase
MHATLTHRAGAGPGSSATSWHEARDRAHRAATPLPAELIAIGDAAGRTLAEPVHAAVSLPACDNSAMDGWAVRGDAPWLVVGRVLAGSGAATGLQDGQAVEIATGAPVPAGARRVIRYEAGELLGDLLHAVDEERSHIRRAGEHVLAGQEVLAGGELLRPAALGLAASVGIDTVAVRRRPTVRVLVTGNEVIPAGVPEAGLVRDAIGPVVQALVPAWGGVGESLPLRAAARGSGPSGRWVPDAPGTLARAVEDSLSTVDVTVVCGATSVGPADHLHAILRDLGAFLHVDGVDCRPGHPQLLAQVGVHWIVGLPGNPYAALVAAHTILGPLMAGLAGQRLPDLPRASLTATVPHDDRHTRVVPVRWQGSRVRVLDGVRPGYLGAAAHADALAVIPPGAQPDPLVELLSVPMGT